MTLQLLLRTRTLAARPLLWRHRHHVNAAVRAFASLPEGVEPLHMPALSPTMTVGTISNWLKNEGEQLQPGDVLCQIETDKAVVDYEMQDEVVLARIVLPTGTADVPVGATLAFTVDDLETYEQLKSSGALSNLSGDAASTEKKEEHETPAAEAPAKESASPKAEQSHGGRTPLIKFLGKRSLLHQSKAESSAATAPTTTSTDAAKSTSTPAAASSPSTEENSEFMDIPLNNMRKVIAKRLTASKVDVPHHYANIDCEIDNILKLRQRLKSQHSVKVSMNDFIIKAVALALRDVPEANCFFDNKSQSVQPNKSVDISVAVATATGLITPIIPKVDALGLSGVNSVFMELVGRARQNKLKPEEYQGGSFTISNLGGFGIDSFTAVINPPQACIMAVGRGRKEVLPPLTLVDGVDAEPRVASLLSVTLSADRRVVDDVIAGQFLQVFKSYMESPELMVL